MVQYEPGSSLQEHMVYYRSFGQRGLRRVSAAVRLLWMRVRIPPGIWMSVSCKLCVFSGRRLCVGLITRLEELYRVLCVSVIVKPRSWGGPGPLGIAASRKKNEALFPDLVWYRDKTSYKLFNKIKKFKAIMHFMDRELSATTRG